MFKELSTNEKISDRDARLIQFWQENKIFEKSVSERSADNSYVFYDGPPFISGLPHYGHLLGSIAKDIIPRYWTMKGKRVERVWGWDAHGLTVENKVQKEQGIKNRRDIEKFGVKKFVDACYEYTSRISSEWGWYIDRIGRWVDMEHAYKTTDQTYMESTIWAFKQLYDKGLIYEGLRTSLFCPTCGTPVSNFEVGLDDSYKDVEDPAVTIEFPITSEGPFKGSVILAWTTTPWTLPSNEALVIDPEAIYVEFEGQTEGSRFIVAKPRLESVNAGDTYKVIREFKGRDLLGLTYEPPFRFFKTSDNAYKVYEFSGMVNMEDGTGIVHSAPGFGIIDTEMGRHFGLSLMQTINDDGKFAAGDNGANPYEGLFYKAADKLIMEDLAKPELNRLFKSARITHRFPYHDRCDTLLIQRAQHSWFVNVSGLKEAMLKNNQDINWVPEHIKAGRFALGIEQAPDWCISRNRFWGTPMPVWESADGDRIVVSSINEIEELSGQKVVDLHRPAIDDIVLHKDGKDYKRRSEVLDSWFEAGSMPYAQFHYPFENKKKFEKNYPGDYIVEYIAQTRAWFFFMHTLSTALFGSNSFKNAICTGVMAGSDGRKMSKSYNNYADPKGVIEKYGGDALRLYLMNSPLMIGENANFDEQGLKTKANNVINPLINSLKYFVTYANLNNWSPTSHVSSEDVLDQWITARLNQTTSVVASNIESYTVPAAVEAVETFVDDLSRWYVRRSRSRISSGDNAALSTLYNVLLTFSKVAAPIIPFVSEEIYLALRENNSEESVHLCSFPICIESDESEIINKMRDTREIVSKALSLRTEKKINVRQPLRLLEVKTKYNNYYKEIIMEEVNVKDVTSSQIDEDIKLDIVITPELKVEGDARALTRELQDLRKEAGLTPADTVVADFADTLENKLAVEKFGEEIKNKVRAVALTPGALTKVVKTT
ncbi:MAG: isoleucine--tRNA ligase [candidate division WWE3 bacterium]|nr:isoleucine--tRNA ligase [candidate division WWE3 bacterium]